MTEGILKVKLPTIWTDGQAEVGRVIEEKRRREKIREKSQKKEDAGARKGRKVAKHCVFQWFVAPEGRKVGSLKRRVRRHLVRWEMKNCTLLWRKAHFKVKWAKHLSLGALLEVEITKKCTPLWREAHFEAKSVKNWQSWTTFESWDVEDVHAVVARSTFPNQNV